MSILTKVFVILLVLFSIAFSMMTVSVVSQTARWKDNSDKYEEKAKIAETNLRNLVAARAAEQASARDKILIMQSTLGKLEQDLEQSRNEVASLRGQVAESAAQKSTAEAINRGLLSRLEVAEARSKEYRDQRDGLEKRATELETRNIDLQGRVNELIQTVAVLEQEKRHFEQQVATLQQENQRLSAATGRPGSNAALESATGMALRGVTSRDAATRSAIHGKVIEVKGNALTISVGSADGVKEGMVFVIHREGEYVADLQVDVVDPNRAAGKLIQRAGEPRVDDLITDAAWFASTGG